MYSIYRAWAAVKPEDSTGSTAQRWVSRLRFAAAVQRMRCTSLDTRGIHTRFGPQWGLVPGKLFHRTTAESTVAVPKNTKTEALPQNRLNQDSLGPGSVAS
jgi:hypothetical protein